VSHQTKNSLTDWQIDIMRLQHRTPARAMHGTGKMDTSQCSFFLSKC